MTHDIEVTGSYGNGGLVPLAVVKRNGHPESWHFGALVVLDAQGRIELALGDSNLRLFPRSALKPVQGVAMLQMGLGLVGEELAIACSSHSGRPEHLACVEGILAKAGLRVDALGNTSDYPLEASLGPVCTYSGPGPSRLTMNCSGKHAAMLLTSAINGWSTSNDYLDRRHPVQQGIRDTALRLVGASLQSGGGDGCGAPTYTCTLTDLAQAFRTIAGGPQGSPEGAVYDAFTSHPYAVAGPGRIATRIMTSAPGVVAKDGAEGVLAMGFPEGGAAVIKIADGSTRALDPVVRLLLQAKAQGALLAESQTPAAPGVVVEPTEELEGWVTN
jgi:L-asparaginase II